MPRGGYRSTRQFDRRSFGQLVGLMVRSCPACGLEHDRVPPTCQRRIEETLAASPSDRHRQERKGA